jgi:hypothetical protein
MDIKDLVQNPWFTAQQVKNSPSKIVTILDGGRIEEATDKEGERYRVLTLTVNLDGEKKLWKLNKYSAKKLSERFGLETNLWIGKQVLLTTMLMQGGKEGIVPV